MTRSRNNPSGNRAKVDDSTLDGSQVGPKVRYNTTRPRNLPSHAETMLQHLEQRIEDIASVKSTMRKLLAYVKGTMPPPVDPGPSKKKTSRRYHTESHRSKFKTRAHSRLLDIHGDAWDHLEANGGRNRGEEDKVSSRGTRQSDRK